MAGIGFGTNYDVEKANGLGARTIIVKVYHEDGSGNDVTETLLEGFVNYVTKASGAGADAFTVAAVSASVATGVEEIYVAIQGTGTYTADTTGAHGVTKLATAIVATFDQA